MELSLKTGLLKQSPNLPLITRESVATHWYLHAVVAPPLQPRFPFLWLQSPQSAVVWKHQMKNSRNEQLPRFKLCSTLSSPTGLPASCSAPLGAQILLCPAHRHCLTCSALSRPRYRIVSESWCLCSRNPYFTSRWPQRHSPNFHYSILLYLFCFIVSYCC